MAVQELPSLAAVNQQRPQSFHPRCIVYRRHGAFLAECIDLNLIVRAKTIEEAIESLKPAISGYLKTAFSGPIEGLVPRPSPLSHRIRYHLLKVLSWIHGTANVRFFRMNERCER